MKIHVPSIPLEGQSFQFDQTTGWFREVLVERFLDLFPKGGNASFQVNLERTGQNVSLTGHVTTLLHPTCARCGNSFSMQLDVPFLRNMAPFFPNPEGGLNKEEEVELSADDLEFSFYHQEEIDLAEIVSEEIVLALPMRFLCQEFCQGLCPTCGVNLNSQTCQCRPQEPLSPFSVLQGFKKKS